MRRLLIVLPLLALLRPAPGRAGGDADLEACRGLETAVTMDTLEVVGREISAGGTWRAAPGSPGVVVEVQRVEQPIATVPPSQEATP